MTGKEVLKLIKEIYDNNEVFESTALLKILYNCKDVKRITIYQGRMGCAKFNNIPTFKVELAIKIKPSCDSQCKTHRFNLWLRYYDDKHMATIYQLWCHTYASSGPQSSSMKMNINTTADEVRLIGAELPEPISHQATKEELQYNKDTE